MRDIPGTITDRNTDYLVHCAPSVHLEKAWDFDSTLNGYQELAATFDIYTAEHKFLAHILGVADEAGEVAGKVKKLLRDEGFSGKATDLTQEQRDALESELGDVLWYVAAVARDLNISLARVASENIAKLFSRRERGVLRGSGDNR